jgi:transcription initiation factor IIE alpha subunit
MMTQKETQKILNILVNDQLVVYNQVREKDATATIFLQTYSIDMQEIIKQIIKIHL